MTFNQNQLNKVSDFNGLLEAHEGVHVANGSDWVLSGFSNNANPSHYQDEFEAYAVFAHIAEGLGYSTYGVSFGNRNYPLFDSGWSRDAGCPRRRFYVSVFLFPGNCHFSETGHLPLTCRCWGGLGASRVDTRGFCMDVNIKGLREEGFVSL